jgi:2-methylisocitrate lyase-like PEP mutase family enzyme
MLEAVLAGAGSPSIDELARLGVARVSLGSGPIRAAMTLMQHLADELLTHGTYSSLDGIVSHARMNELMGSWERSWPACNSRTRRTRKRAN